MLLEEFQKANHQLSKHIVKDSEQWTNSTPPWYKINVDCATFQSQQASSVEAIIRDLGGLVAAALSKKLYFSLGSLKVEAKFVGGPRIVLGTLV